MSLLNRRIKAACGRAVYRSGLYESRLADRAVIVAFHRIDDSETGSGLNCSRKVFAALCGFFAEFFDVMSLAELLKRINTGAPIGRALAITFDDGYKDNVTVAADILRRHALPATFFVSTNFIGSATVPRWDAADGVRSEWMTWDDLRALRAAGFDIGGHTENHVDLGSVDLELAAREIRGCRATLERELGAPVVHFAYPFGGPENIRPETRDIIKAAGFTCCLSCHGGVVSPDDDAYQLQREPLNSWIVSPYQYGYELLRRVRETRT